MLSASSSGRCCPPCCGGGSGWMAGGSSTGACGSSVPGSPGGTFPSDTGHGPWAILHTRFRWWALDGTSTGCSEPRRPGRTRTVTSTGSCRSIPPSSAPTSMPPRPEMGDPKPRTRTLSRRPDQQDSSVLRRGGTASGLHRHRREHRDCTQFTTVMEAIRVPRLGPGRPRVRPAHVLGDKGCNPLHRPRTGRPGPHADAQ